MRRFVLLAFSLVLLAPTAHAQVNTEKLRTGDPAPGFSGWIDGTVNLRRGNVQLLQVGLGARLEYNTEQHFTFLQGSFNFGEKGEPSDTYVNNGFGHLRWTAMWHPRAGTELFGQLQFNEFLRLNLRVLGGVGLRVPAVVGDVFELIIGSGYMLEYEALDLAADDSSHAATALSHRWSSYVTFKLNVQKWVALASTTYAQPRFDSFGDIRVLEEVALTVDIVTHLSLILSFTLLYDSDPPDGVETTDIGLEPKLRVTF